MYLYIRIIAFVFLIPLIGLISVKRVNANPQGNRSVIAVVNGEKILYKDIKVDPKYVQLAHPKKLNPSQMKTAILEYEKDELASKIWGIIKTKKIIELGLAVNEEEIDRELEKKFKISGIDDKKAKEISTMYQVLANALEAWQKDTSKGDVIYNEKLASMYSKREWKLFQVSYDTPEKLAEMRSLIPSGIADMKKQSRRSTKEDLLFKKMKDAITSNVSVSNEGIKAYYQQRYGHLSEMPNLDEVKVALGQELLSKKKQDAEAAWWQEQYKKAKIEIKDERFKDMLKKMIPARKEK